MLGEETLIIPFTYLKLLNSGREWSIIVETHFICSLPAEQRILLVSAYKGDPRSDVAGRFLNPCVTSGLEVLGKLREGYDRLIEKKGANIRKKEGFAGRFLASELRRLFFGGLASSPPTPEISEERKNKFLIELYRVALGADPKSTRLLSSRSMGIPFIFHRGERFLEIRDDRYRSFERILNKLLSENVIEL